MVFQHKTLKLLILTGFVIAGIHGIAAIQSKLLIPGAIAQTVPEEKPEGDRLFELGREQYERHQFGYALETWRRALEIYQAIGDQKGESRTLMGLGNIYNSLGQYPRAEQSYQQFLQIARDLGDRTLEGQGLTALGKVEQNRGQYNRSEQLYQESLAIFTEIGDKSGIANALIGLGTIYHRRWVQYDRAQEFYQQALTLAREIGDRTTEAQSLHSIGSLYNSQEDYERAVEFYEPAAIIRWELNEREGLGTTLHHLGLAYYRLEQYYKAEDYLFATIEVREELYPSLTDDQKLSLFEQQLYTYDRLQKALIAQDKTDKALEISERGRARAFVELLAQKNTEPLEENRLLVPPPTLDQIRQIAASQNATIVQYSRIRGDFSRRSPTFLEKLELYIWVIKPTGEITFHRTDLQDLWQEQDTLLAKIVANARCFDNWVCRQNITTAQRSDVSEVYSQPIGEFNHQAAQGQTIAHSQRGNEQELHQLYQLLIEPIADLLPSDPNERVIFIPQDSLFLVPFPALPDANGKYLIEKHTILTAASIQVLDLTRRQRQTLPQTQSDILIVGNPTMPMIGDRRLSPLLGAETEAQAIAQLLNTTPLIGAEATKARVIEKMETSRIIHLATHGSFDPERGIGSWLALAPSESDDGFLTAEEILDLELSAELVVLSACDTGRGKITGDGVIGLSRSFISAGVPSILVSLWKVDDKVTAYLMGEFYQNWQKGSNKAQALREAMLTTMQQYPGVENWAAFTLIGEAE